MQYSHNVVPSERLTDKFHFFYQPYSFETNTHRWMSFGDSKDETKVQVLETLLREQKKRIEAFAVKNDF